MTEKITPQELKNKIDSNEKIVIGALSNLKLLGAILYSDLERELTRLPKTTKMILY